MANYRQVSYGSRGSDVTELQKLLNNNGYNLSVDGDFGAKTQAAVKDYQQKNGLDVDGIVGNNTWGALTKTRAPAQTAAPAATAPAAAQTFTYQPYEQSDSVKQAKALLDQHLSTKPGDFTWGNQALLDETTQKWMNREDFSYDFSSDPLYQQYRDQYTHLGQLAMMDTMGQAAALTGGYGNSYAQTAGQQAYQGYLQQLNNVMPELYNAAYGRYQAEGQELYNQIALLEAQRQQAYGEHQDQLNDWYNYLSHLASDYQYQDETAYNRHYNDQNFQYGQYRDMIADQQYQEQFDYQKQRDAIADEQWQKQYDLSVASASRSASRSGGGGGDDIPSYIVDRLEKGFNSDEEKMAYLVEQAQTGAITSTEMGQLAAAYPSAGGTKPVADTSGVSKNILERLAGFTNDVELGNYLDNLEAGGAIGSDVSDALFAEYMTGIDYAAVDDGGVNWWLGIDNNAKVRDKNGKVYRLDELYDELVKGGMSEDDAKKYVVNLQEDLGIG